MLRRHCGLLRGRSCLLRRRLRVGKRIADFRQRRDQPLSRLGSRVDGLRQREECFRTIRHGLVDTGECVADDLLCCGQLLRIAGKRVENRAQLAHRLLARLLGEFGDFLAAVAGIVSRIGHGLEFIGQIEQPVEQLAASLAAQILRLDQRAECLAGGRDRQSQLGKPCRQRGLRLFSGQLQLLALAIKIAIEKLRFAGEIIQPASQIDQVFTRGNRCQADPAKCFGGVFAHGQQDGVGGGDFLIEPGKRLRRGFAEAGKLVDIRHHPGNQLISGASDFSGQLLASF